MLNSYYRKKMYLASLSPKDEITGGVEKWRAHREGILHRGFTCILQYNDKYILQHRKHVAFDKYWDFTFSSHQLYQNSEIQPDLESIQYNLSREWLLTPQDLVNEPTYLGTIYYKASDPNSVYIEHEFDYIYLAELKRLPEINPDFSYGFEISTLNFTGYKLCPWVNEMVKKVSLVVK